MRATPARLRSGCVRRGALLGVALLLCLKPGVALAQQGFVITNAPKGMEWVLGCIQTVSGVNCANKYGGMLQSGRGGVPNMGGLLGGILTSVLTSIAIDALSKAATSSAPSAQQAALPSQRFDPVQQAVDQQRRFQEGRERQLLAALADTSASRLLDASSSLTLLEPLAEHARLGFDTPLAQDPDALWMSTHDPWFSTDAAAGGGQASGARPLAMSDQPLEYSDASADPLQCMATLGSQLCAFPDTKGPAITLDPIASVPAPPQPMAAIPPVHGGPAVGAPPVQGSPVPIQSHTPTAPGPSGPKPSAGASGADPGGIRIGGDTPQALGQGAPDISPGFRPVGPGLQVPQYPCESSVAFEDKSVLVAAARRRLAALAEQGEDPRSYVDVLTTTVIDKLALLRGVQGAGANVALKAYRSFVDQLICNVFSMLTDVVTNPAAAGQKSEEILESAGHGLVDAMAGGKTIRLALTGSAEQAWEGMKARVEEDVRKGVYDAVENLLKGSATKLGKGILEQLRETYERSRDPHRLNPLIEQMRYFTLKTINPYDNPFFERYRRLQELTPAQPKSPGWARESAKELFKTVYKQATGDEVQRAIKFSDEWAREALKGVERRAHHWLLTWMP